MPTLCEKLALAAFQRAAQRVPAYRVVLAEAGIDSDTIRAPADFARLPILTKAKTFQRFPLDQLCLDGKLGRLGSVLTSSGHSGVFAFGITDAEALPAMTRWIDDLLDLLFRVRTQPTLLINCLPMGVKVPTLACTLADTSVRPDMVVALMRALGPYYAQVILVGEAAFIKHTLELGRQSGVDWRTRRVHVIVGEEPLAENARKYLGAILGHELARPEAGMIVSSMGVAEVGLNLFFEAPPRAALMQLRRLLHEDVGLRHSLLGPTDWVPSIFAYDPRRIQVDFTSGGELLLTTLDPETRIPLIRYATGDRGRVLGLPETIRSTLEAAGVAWAELSAAAPLVLIEGRGACAWAGQAAVYPEAVKEGLYHDPALAELTTANFRLGSGAVTARVRIQLAPGVAVTTRLAEQFQVAIQYYARPPLTVVCETYDSFGSGMALDYERKFAYLGE